MSSSYGFILDTLRYSYSSVSTYETCPFAFKLAYIDQVKREQNFFSDYGLLIHACIEQYFRNNLESFELVDYFNEMYSIYIKNPAPSFSPGMEERYRKSGEEFFKNFSFNRNGYEALDIESTIEFTLPSGTLFTARPDLVLKNKKTGKLSLFDYKSSAVFKTNVNGFETTDTKKLSGYMRQAYIYAYALRTQKNYNISNIVIWFTRPEKKHIVKWDKAKEDIAIARLEKTIEWIKNDENFMYDNSNPFFCENLCNVRNSCPYWH